MRFEIRLNVNVTDPAELRDYAMKRAHDAGIPKKEFLECETDDVPHNIEYWLGLAINGGTPEGCGFEIEEGCAAFKGDAS